MCRHLCAKRRKSRRKVSKRRNSMNKLVLLFCVMYAVGIKAEDTITVVNASDVGLRIEFFVERPLGVLCVDGVCHNIKPQPYQKTAGLIKRGETKVVIVPSVREDEKIASVKFFNDIISAFVIT